MITVCLTYAASSLNVSQLKNEFWIFRGSVARDTRLQISRLYELTAPESILARARTQDERDALKLKYTTKKIESLFDEHRYLKLVNDVTPVRQIFGVGKTANYALTHRSRPLHPSPIPQSKNSFYTSSSPRHGVPGERFRRVYPSSNRKRSSQFPLRR